MSETKQGTILYGMMGAGKTTLGKALAKHQGQSFTDTDLLIQYRYGRTPAEIVAAANRDFPQHQADAIKDYRPTEPEVVATGGSVAMYPELVAHLGQFGVGIFVNVDAEELESRLSPERIAALNNPDNLSFAELYAARAESYQTAADLTLDVPARQFKEVTIANIIELRASV